MLRWARHHRLLPKLVISIINRELQISPFGRSERLGCLRDLLLSDTMPLPYRVAGGLLLLFGLGVSRIVALQRGHIRTVVDARHGHVTEIRLAEDWIIVAEPFASVLRTHLNARPTINTATNSDAQWLFPGDAPGQHLGAAVLAETLVRYGIAPRSGRTGTWQQLFREGPPQLLARSLGVSPGTALKHAALAGSGWTAYAAIRARASSSSTRR